MLKIKINIKVKDVYSVWKAQVREIPQNPGRI
jgi:hypothetical protein